MRINRERMRNVKKKVDKKLQEDIKKNPQVYKDCINDLKVIKEKLSKVDSNGGNIDVLALNINVAESSFYEALASGLKRKDISFFENYIDRLQTKYKKALQKKENRIKNNKEIDTLKKQFDELFKI